MTASVTVASATASSRTSSSTTPPPEGPLESEASAVAFGSDPDGVDELASSRDFSPPDELLEEPCPEPEPPSRDAPGTSLDEPKLFSDR